MPKYIANAYLVQKGKVIQTGNKIELTEDQAKRLKDKVSIVDGQETDSGEGVAEEYTEASLKQLNAEEQKAIVEELEGDLDELTNEEKRVAFILENQEQE